MTAIRSMTGYGRGERSRPGLRATVELRSVNHRFLDVQARLPRGWLALETALVGRIREHLDRGRIELFARRDGQGQGESDARVDVDLVRGIMGGATRLGAELGIEGDLRLADVLALPGVVVTVEREVDVEGEAAVVQGALDDAIAALDRMRALEGVRLAADVSARLDRVADLRSRIAERVAEVPDVIRARLQRRVADLLADAEMRLDPDRLAQEVALLADRADVQEELTRLGSHLEQARALLRGDEPVGRRLEFLAQELNREANTIGSKSTEGHVSALVVDLKSEVERIREQVANLE